MNDTSKAPGGNSATLNNTEQSPIFEQLMAIARTSILEEMASGFAHEINQPLGAIATYAQAAERMLVRPEPMVTAAVDVLRQIATEALNAGEGIRRIRRLFNREPGEKVRCSIAGLFVELQPLLALLGERTGIPLEVDIAKSLPDVVVDRMRISHVLFTLVQNAFEASGAANRKAVKVAAASDRYSVEVSVTDHGSGVSSDAQQQLFRPFFTTKASGTGLGLASSRAIVEMHGGTIGYKAVPDGTRFWFSLPACTDPT